MVLRKGRKRRKMLITAATWKLDANYEVSSEHFEAAIMNEASYLILQRPDLYGYGTSEFRKPKWRKLELASYASTLSQQNYW
jgi:hypothetical protein